MLLVALLLAVAGCADGPGAGDDTAGVTGGCAGISPVVSPGEGQVSMLVRLDRRALLGDPAPGCR